jgi:serine/threonine protein kinase
VKICPRCAELFTDDARFCPHDGQELDKSRDRFLGRKIAARYHLIKKLGSGGMSVVYLARHELIARLSAIKILRPELAQIKEHHDRFIREARAVNRINHENVVEITDVGESDGITYLVMEYIEGPSLLDAINSGRMAWPRAVRIAMQIASALARTHQAGIIHRDLKPENILLVAAREGREGREAREGREEREDRDEPADEVVKILDFGIAKVSGEPTLTMNEQLFGTPGYIAPEYVGGLGIDGRADLYSLAVVLYEMVTGVLPFDARGQSELLLKPLTNAPIPPGQRVQGLPPDLESLLLRGLARDPNERPHDAFAFHDALADILRRFGGDAAAASPGARARARRESEAPSEERDPRETIVDRISALPGGRETANLGKLETREMSSRWHAALADLESLIAKARKSGGEHARAAGRAAEMALVAGEMIPRVERAAKMVSEVQAKVDRLEAKGREFRGNLGHAIDVLVHDRSREHAHVAQLRARRQALERATAFGAQSAPDPFATAPMAPPMPASGAGVNARAWEIEALGHEEKRSEGVLSDLSFQIESLQRQLDQRNEELERELLGATGTLEGLLSAHRRLTSELVRTIDDGVDMLQQVG